jgi:hypothetical protein
LQRSDLADGLSVDFHEQDPGIQQRFERRKYKGGNKPIKPAQASGDYDYADARERNGLFGYQEKNGKTA